MVGVLGATPAASGWGVTLSVSLSCTWNLPIGFRSGCRNTVFNKLLIADSGKGHVEE